MKRFIQKLVTPLALILLIAATPAVAFAAPAPEPATPTTSSAARTQACGALDALGNTSSCDKGDTTVNKVVSAVVNILSTVVGIAAVIMIVVSAFKYITANGDSGSISSAKSTLIYAIVGLVIVASAQAITRFVFDNFGK